MFLKSIKLKNFRNFSDIEINFTKNITALIGDNAQGKTNFLESIYFLATGRPIKADADFEAIKFGLGSVWVEGIIEKNPDKENIKLTTALQKVDERLSKKFLVNGVARRLIDYTGNLIIVFFRPEDLDLVTGSPSLRREYLDRCISQIDRHYRKTLQDYQKVTIQKNKLLKIIKEGLALPFELEFWNNQQINLGIILQKKRQDFINSINSFENQFGDFEYLYLPNEISKKRLEEYFDKEIGAVVSLIGPHRDDFAFLLEGKDLAKYGSRGEQRTAVLDLKMSELSFFEDLIGERPVLLLDDIFSELDLSHRKHVLNLSNKQQTIITTIEFDDYLQKALKGEQIFSVKNGEITG